MSEVFYTFSLPAACPPTPDTTTLLAYLLSKQPPSSGEWLVYNFVALHSMTVSVGPLVHQMVDCSLH